MVNTNKTSEFGQWNSHQVANWLLEQNCDSSAVKIIVENDCNGSSLLLFRSGDLVDLGMKKGQAKLIIKLVWQNFKNTDIQINKTTPLVSDQSLPNIHVGKVPELAHQESVKITIPTSSNQIAAMNHVSTESVKPSNHNTNSWKVGIFTLCTTCPLLLVGFVLISTICSYALHSNQFSQNAISQTACILAIVIAISISLGFICNLIFTLYLFINKKPLYYVVHVVFALIFGVLFVFFVYLMILYVPPKDEDTYNNCLALLTLLSICGICILCLDIFKIKHQQIIFNICARVFKFSVKRNWASLLFLMILGLVTHVMSVYFVFMSYSPNEEGLFISQIIILFIVMELITNIIHYSMSDMIKQDVEKKKRWFSPLSSILNTIVVKGLELVVMSFFSFWHHFIYILRDISMIVVAWAPVFAKVASKIGFNFVNTASETYVARYRNVYTGEVFTRSGTSFNMVSFVIGIALVILAIFAGLLWIVCFFTFLFSSLFILFSSRLLLVKSEPWIFMCVLERLKMLGRYFNFSIVGALDFIMSQMVVGDELSNNVIHQIERLKAISGLTCTIVMFFLKDKIYPNNTTSFLSIHYLVVYFIGVLVCGMILQFIEAPIIFSIRLLFFNDKSNTEDKGSQTYSKEQLTLFEMNSLYKEQYGCELFDENLYGDTRIILNMY